MRDMIIGAFQDSAQLKMKFVTENVNRIITVVEAITDAIKRGNKVIVFGNGGSAADAQHIAAEFVNRFLIDRRPLPALSLTTDTSIITSIGNDRGFSEIFSRQIMALGKGGDVALGISTSGNSVNVVNALRAAKEMDIKTIGMTGGDGGEVADMVDYLLSVGSGSVPRIQEVHITIGHIICDMVDRMLFR